MSRDRPHVLVLTGTSDRPFGRLLRSLPALAGSDLVEDVRVQARVAVPSSPRIVAIGMLTRDDVRREMAAADAVVTHGGSGSCLEAVAIGHVPVIVPRRRSLGEAADDHQSDLANELARRGLAVVAEDPLDPGLSHAVLEAARARGGPRPMPSLGPSLRRLRDALTRGRTRSGSGVRVLRVEEREHTEASAGLPWRSPLQAAAWGNARREDGWTPRWWVARDARGHVLAAAQTLTRRAGAPRYLPYGPTLADHPQAPAAGRALLRHLTRGHVAGLLWAPGWFHARLGLHGRVGDLPLAAGSLTGLLDLSTDDAALRRGMRGTWRRDLEKAERDASYVTTLDDPSQAAPALLEDVAALAGRKGFTPPVSRSVGARFASGAAASGVVLLAPTVRAEGKVLARVLVAVTGGLAQTLWTAAEADERAAGAGRVALWHAIRAAREAGARTYDLAGIDDVGNPGVARFKRGLGPDVVEVPGLAWIPPAWTPRAVALPLVSLVRDFASRPPGRPVPALPPAP